MGRHILALRHAAEAVLEDPPADVMGGKEAEVQKGGER